MQRFQRTGSGPLFHKPVAQIPAVAPVKKRMFLRHVIWWMMVIVCGVGLNNYWMFYHSDPWVVRSPRSSWWAANILEEGFLDISLSFRVHDLVASPFGPRYICDLYWEDRYMAHEMHWSADGSVVAITISFTQGCHYGCAYDFRRHEALGENLGSPLEYSPALTASIEQLMKERGGVSKIENMPDPTKG